jgi:hypothetical protein
MSRRLPPPWRVEQFPGAIKYWTLTGSSLAFVYGHEITANADTAHVLTLDEARRIATNIKRLNGSNVTRLREVSLLHHFTGMNASPKDFVSNGAFRNDRLC